MPIALENTGSTARDFCMLERNFLSHIKLALLISLLSSAVLLRARLPTPYETNTPHALSSASIPMASIQMVASLTAIAVGVWEYQSSFRDMRNTRAFLTASKPHFAVISIVAGVVLATCILLLANENEL